MASDNPIISEIRAPLEKLQLILKKIWNIFEFAICFNCSSDDENGAMIKTNVDNLMLDRHLDQLLMCSIYGACKAHGLTGVKFQDIMKHYRIINAVGSNTNHVYRSVRSDNEDEEERGDLIAFYNRIFLRKLKVYISQLNHQHQHHKVGLFFFFSLLRLSLY